MRAFPSRRAISTPSPIPARRTDRSKPYHTIEVRVKRPGLELAHARRLLPQLIRHSFRVHCPGVTRQFCVSDKAAFVARITARNYFLPIASLFSFLHFWNFFLTSAALTRKRTIASLRWIGSLLRGENGSRSDCANRPRQGNARHRVRSEENVSNRAATSVPPFFICSCRAAVRIVLAGSTRPEAVPAPPARYSSPEALAAAPCSRAGQMDS